jgi:Tol biopolymer transport system component
MALAALAALALTSAVSPAAFAQTAADLAKVQSVTVSPDAPTVFVGQTEQFAAAIRYEGDKDLKLAPTWSVTGEIGTVDQNGLFTAGPKRAKGAVVATLGAKTDAAEVEVVPYGYGACHVDGRMLYTMSGPSNDSEFDLAVMAGDGSDPRSLTPNPAEPADDYDTIFDSGYAGSWSPDGARIVYMAFAGYGESVVCTMAADGSDKRVVLRSQTLEFGRPSFSTDGTKILLDARPVSEGVPTGARDLCLVDPDGGDLTPLTRDPAPEEDASWSPDGKRIAFVKERETPDGTICEIWTMDADGRNPKRLTPAGDVDFRTPAWSPDGASVACMMRGGDVGAVWEIALVPVDGSPVVRLTEDPTITKYGPVWSWDGSHVLYASTDDPGLVMEIWSVAPEAGATPENVTQRPDDGNRFREYTY